MKKIILFDMDGTLINSSRDITISINHVRNTLYTLDPLNEQFVIDAINAHERNLAALFYETHVYEADAKELFEAHYWDQCICNVQPYDGVSEMLKNFSEQGCLMSVATNAPSIFAKRMLEHLEIAQFFGSIIGADNVQLPKPHPEMLEILLDYHDYDEYPDDDDDDVDDDMRYCPKLGCVKILRIRPISRWVGGYVCVRRNMWQ
jgi:phosphoglycolate phosphatase